MKKVININFQGRVIPIEESAYEMLQQYTASLRTYFANEDGRDEIINDIESRIAELFAEQLKKGSACITDDDVNAIMDSMGRPADFDAQDEAAKETSAAQDAGTQQTQSSSSSYQESGFQQQAGTEKKRLYRDEEDKILGGVCSGLAHYLNIDPAIVRIIFALLAFGLGTGFLLYIILWIVLPSRSLVTNIRKRLYRDSDEKVIGGVCGGLAKYFDINVAIPRVIFAAPFIFGLITSIGRNFFMSGPVYIGGFSGGTFILTYIILWIVLPEATTASEKLEMKGEKVDLKSISNTIKEDLQGFKGRAEKMGKDLKSGATRMADEAKTTWEEKGKPFVADTANVAKSGSRGLGHAIVILAKAFVIFVLGCIAFGLFVALIALLGTGVGILPLKDFLLEGTGQSLLAFGSLFLFLGVPIIAFITWLIRRLIKVRTHNRYIGYTFSALWTIGLICVIFLVATVSRNFSSQVGKREDVAITQPVSGKLIVKVAEGNIKSYDGWLQVDGTIDLDGDTLFLNTVRVNVIRSTDSLYHVHVVKMSKGKDKDNARSLAEKIDFRVTQKDSILYLPESFGIHKNDKWRNQRIMVVIEVPVGKMIRLDERIDDYDYFNVEVGNRNRRNWRIDWNRDWEDGEYWNTDKDMIMTPEKLMPLMRKGNGKNSDKIYRYDEEEPQEDVIPSEPSGPQPPKSPDTKKDSATKTVYRYDDNSNEEDASDDASSTTERSRVDLNVFSPLSSILK